jgi:hypothetical protein
MELTSDKPDSVRKIVKAMIDRALAQCDRSGVRWEDFYTAMLTEQRLNDKSSLEGLLDRTFKRLKIASK